MLFYAGSNNSVVFLNIRAHTLLYIGALASDLVCVALIWNITVTGDTSREWLIWGFVILGFTSVIMGYLTEKRYREAHPEEYMPRLPDEP